MSALWKVLVGLAVALPMVAYVAGSFLATGATEPPGREPIVIRDAPAQVVEQPPVLTPKPTPRPGGGDDDDDDEGPDDDGPTGDADDEIRIVTPQPTRVDDDDDDDDDTDDSDDDSRDGDD